ncbi:MAG: DUF4340 domain-containing protein [Candidatus Aminicenantales bacterium]
MKIKNTLILLLVFLGLLLFVVFIEKKPPDAGAKPEEKLIAVASADVQKLALKRDAETLTFKRDDKGEWMVVEPFETKADSAEVNGLVDAFADLKIDRVVEKTGGDPKKYEIPKREVSLWIKGQDKPIRVLLGPPNKIDATVYAQKEGDPRIVLLPSTLTTPLEKKLFDFRQKDVFKFETKDVTSVSVSARGARWEAAKKDDEWMLTAPLKALAKESKMTGLLDSLSGLRAKEFTAEDKKPGDLKKAGLDKPEYTVTLKMAGANKETVFAFHKADDRTYVTTSASTKIIVPETDVLPDLEKKPADLREGKVAAFNAWQADKLVLRKGPLALTITKAANDKWYFDAAQKEEADASKVDSFVRRIEGLESTEFIDAPKSLAEFGLDKPEAEATVGTKDTVSTPPVEKAHCSRSMKWPNARGKPECRRACARG